MILIFYPKFYGYSVKIFFICKYRETQALSALIINLSLVGYTSGYHCISDIEVYWTDYAQSVITLILRENHSPEGVICHQQIIETFYRHTGERNYYDLGVSLALLDKLIMETDLEKLILETPYFKNNIYDQYQKLLLQYNVEEFPLIRDVHVTQATPYQIKEFMLFSIKQSMLYMLDPYFFYIIDDGVKIYPEDMPEDIRKSLNEYQEFYDYLIGSRYKAKEIIINIFRFFGATDVYCTIYSKYIKPENLDDYVTVPAELFLPHAQIDIPMLPDLNQIPDLNPPTQPALEDGAISPGRKNIYLDGHWFPTRYGNQVELAEHGIAYYTPLIVLGISSLGLGALAVYLKDYQ